MILYNYNTNDDLCLIGQVKYIIYKVDNPYSVTSLIEAPIFEWYVTYVG